MTFIGQESVRPRLLCAGLLACRILLINFFLHNEQNSPVRYVEQGIRIDCLDKQIIGDVIIFIDRFAVLVRNGFAVKLIAAQNDQTALALEQHVTAGVSGSAEYLARP